MYIVLVHDFSVYISVCVYLHVSEEGSQLYWNQLERN